MKLSEDEKRALREYRDRNGRTWKSKLRYAWENASEPGILQRLRNASYFGPSGLVRVRPADLEPAGDPFAAFMANLDAVKAEYPGVLCLYKMGDFYEAFRDDARTLANVCQLTLTERRGIPMAGLPYHHLDAYLAKLVSAGVRVALCEQVGEAKPGEPVQRKVLPGSLTS